MGSLATLGATEEFAGAMAGAVGAGARAMRNRRPEWGTLSTLGRSPAEPPPDIPVGDWAQPILHPRTGQMVDPWTLSPNELRDLFQAIASPSPPKEQYPRGPR